MKRFWILTNAEGSPLVDPVARLFIFEDKGADDEHFYHAQSHAILSKQGMDAHLNEVALVDLDKLSDLLAAVRIAKRVGVRYDNGGISFNYNTWRAIEDALAAFEGRDGE